MTQKQIFEISKEHFVREFNTTETLQLLRSYGYKFWSWGADKFVNLKDKGLSFKVNGNKHKGFVLITLNASDLYEVRLYSTTGKNKCTMIDVYFDELFDRIDEKIEKIAIYSH